MIKLIESINLSYGTGDVIGLRQGDLDGACGIYSVLIALIAGGIIEKDEAHKIWQNSPDGRTKFSKTISNIPVLVQDGTDIDKQVELIKSIEHYIKKTHNCIPQPIEIKGKRIFSEIFKFIDRSIPVIIHLDWEGHGAHAAVCVGYEFDANQDSDSGGVYHLLLIDPGYSINRVQLWNAVLSCYVEKKGNKPYIYKTEDICNDSFCQIVRAIALTT